MEGQVQVLVRKYQNNVEKFLIVPAPVLLFRYPLPLESTQEKCRTGECGAEFVQAVFIFIF